MRIDVVEVMKSTCDKTGRLAAFEVRTRTNDDHMLLMTLQTASKFFWSLCNAGTLAAKAIEQAGTQSEREALTDYPVLPSMTGAALAEDGMVDLVLRFGQLQLSARLDPTAARSLATQLQRAATEGPTNPQ